MQIINAMSNAEFAKICKAGVELVRQIRLILAAHGLTDEQAGAVMSIASGAVIMTADMTPQQYVESLATSCSLWNIDEQGTGLGSASFCMHTNPELFPATAAGEN